MKLPFENIKREVLIKQEAKTERKEKELTVDELIDYGVINIDKPKGPTSHQVSEFVQKILKIKKSGHSGTLDPGVTGSLVVALGRATRIVQALLKAGKEYIGVMHLHKEVSEEDLMKVIKKFTGKIRQMPPIKSAVKRVLRTREVYYFDIMETDKQEILFKVGCEAGTYIRKLIHDVGQELGGAHMAELRRTKVAGFTEETFVTLQDLTDAFWYYKNENNEKFIRKCIQPIENAVSHLPKVWVFDSTIESLTHGRDLAIPGISKLETFERDELSAVMTLNNELIGIGVAKMNSKEIMENEKGIAVDIKKVFMEA